VIGAQSGVNKSISKPGLYMGTPAIPAAEYREQVAYIHRLGRLSERVQKLERSGAEAAGGAEKVTPGVCSTVIVEVYAS
jgi:hypothetical protein